MRTCRRPGAVSDCGTCVKQPRRGVCPMKSKPSQVIGAFAVAAAVAISVFAPIRVRAQGTRTSGDVTFTHDIAPILQRSCQECHHADGVAPMSLMTYEEVRPWAKASKARSAIRSQRGAMPPFFVEKNIGIQKFKHDPSLTDEEIATIAKWADSGA